MATDNDKTFEQIKKDLEEQKGAPLDEYELWELQRRYKFYNDKYNNNTKKTKKAIDYSADKIIGFTKKDLEYRVDVGAKFADEIPIPGSEDTSSTTSSTTSSAVSPSGTVNIKSKNIYDIYNKYYKGKEVTEEEKKYFREHGGIEKIYEAYGRDINEQAPMPDTNITGLDVEPGELAKAFNIGSLPDNSLSDEKLFEMNDIEEDNIPDTKTKNVPSSMTTGNMIGVLGESLTSSINSVVTLANYLSNRPRKNEFFGFGNDAMARLEDQKTMLRSQDDLLGADLALKERTQAEAAKLGSRGVNTYFAKRLGLHEAGIGQKRRIASDYLDKLLNIGGKETNVSLERDRRYMSEQARINEADRMDKDNTFTQLSRNIVDMGSTMQNIGRGLNQQQSYGQYIDSINAGNKYVQWNDTGGGNYVLGRKPIGIDEETGLTIYGSK